MKSATIVTLTSIPPRYQYLPRVIDSLLNQTLRPDRLELYLPNNYRREDFDQFAAEALPPLPDGCEVIRVEQDFGPATKVLPAAARYRGQDVRLVYCDDDKQYDPRWLEHLVAGSQAHPDHVIAYTGQASQRLEAKGRWQKKGLDYRLLRLASLGLWKPIKSREIYEEDIAEGVGGVLIRPDFIDAVAYDIPDVMWTVDDVWLSGIFRKNGHRLWLLRPDPPIVNRDILLEDNRKLGRHHALVEMVYKNHDRMGANAACIRYMRKAFGVY